MNQPRSPARILAQLRERRRQRGAAVFVVVLVITLLSALGVWAARSATLVDVATGHSRKALQVQYLADLGLQTATAFMANGLASEFVRRGQLGSEICPESNPQVTAQGTPLPAGSQPFCYPFFSRHLDQVFSGSLIETSQTIPGANSLGPQAATEDSPRLLGEFVVEMTDLGPAPPCVGCELDDVNLSVKHGSVALTAVASIHHGLPSDIACTLAGSASAGRQRMRARATVGPLFQ